MENDREIPAWVNQLDGAVREFSNRPADWARFYRFIIRQHDLPPTDRPDPSSLDEALRSRVPNDAWRSQLVAEFDRGNRLLDELRGPA